MRTGEDVRPRSAPPTAPIGVMDSGVGGLSVLRALVRRLPHEQWLYLADQAHLPYGQKPAEALRAYGLRMASFLLEQGAKALVVACNTLSAVALDAMREAFPHVPIVGMEPALKPAVRLSRTGRVGVMATQATLQSPRYRRLKDRFAQQATVVEDPCQGLVERVEAGDLNGPATQRLLTRILAPMQRAGVDVVVLGCTHFPFLEETIRAVLGPQVRLLNPAEAVARRLAQVLEAHGLLAPRGSPPSPQVVAWTTGDPDRWTRQVHTLVPELEVVPKALPNFWAGEVTPSFAGKQGG